MLLEDTFCFIMVFVLIDDVGVEMLLVI